MNKHTPGPWVTEDLFIKDESDNKIAEVHWRRNEDQEVANALLIAAAPDLLEALDSIVEMNPPLPMGMIEAAEAALAKARGEA